MLVPIFCTSQNGTTLLKDIKPLDIIWSDTNKFILFTPDMLKETNLLILRHNLLQNYTDSLESIITKQNKDILTCKEATTSLSTDIRIQQEIIKIYDTEHKGQAALIKKQKRAITGLIIAIVIETVIIILK